MVTLQLPIDAAETLCRVIPGVDLDKAIQGIVRSITEARGESPECDLYILELMLQRYEELFDTVHPEDSNLDVYRATVESGGSVTD